VVEEPQQAAHDKEATMTTSYLSRALQALALAVALAILAAPAAALAGSDSGTRAPDWFERYAAAHPFGDGVADFTQAPDVFERYAASHATALLTDGRSPDTREAANVRRVDVVDRRLPDTVDALYPAQPVQRGRSGSFDWGDAGIGAIAAAMILAFVGGSMMLLTRFHRRERVQAT